jgi:integrase
MAIFKLIKGGKCICGAGAESETCTCERDARYTFSFRFRGKQYTRRTDATTKPKALEIERAFLRGLQGERCEEVLAFLNGDESRMRRLCASVGEVMAAYRDRWHLWLKSETAALRNVNDLALVCAHACDLWIQNDGGRKGIKLGAMVPDLDRIGELSCGRLNRALVRAYYLARQKSAGLAIDDVVWREAPQHAAWNSTLDHACDVFSASAREHALASLRLPDLTEFLKAKRLPEEEALPQPFNAIEFAALCKLFDDLRTTAPDLWLMNVIHRQTGMRPAYVMGLRGSWLVEGEGGKGFIELKARPEEGFGKKAGTLNQFIPVADSLRAQILERGMGLTIGAGLSETARTALQKQHNGLIKRAVGDEGSHGQGAYRYRDTVASALAFLKGVEGAQKALGHVTALTTLQHYARALPGVSELMRAELAGWL